MIRKFNKYDYLLIFTISLLVFGGFGGAMQPIRIFSLAMVPFTVRLILHSKDRKINSTFRGLFIIYLFITISVLWSSDANEGLKEIVYYSAHLNLFLLIILLYKRARSPFISLLAGWSLFIFLTQLVAFNEIFFDQHLNLSKFESDKMINLGGMIVQKKFASVTFGNYNGYVTVVGLSLPFLFSAYIVSFTRKAQLMSLAILGFAIFSLFVNASRGGLIAALIVTATFFLFFKKFGLKNQKFNLIIILPILIFVIARYFNVIFEQILYRQIAGNSFTQDQGRMSLIERALAAFLEKPILGGGVGSVQTEMIGASILLPHNMFLEVLVQFGFFITIFFLLYLFRHIRVAFKSKDYVIKFVLYSSILSLPVVSIINSGYLLMPVLWVYLSSLYCIMTFGIEDEGKESARKEVIYN